MRGRTIPPRGSIPQRTKHNNVFTGHRNGGSNPRTSSPNPFEVNPWRKTGRGSSLPIYPPNTCDVFQEESSIQVVLEMPGVRDEIEVTLEGKTLRVVAASRWRNFKTQVELPQEVSPGFVQKYHKGILIITLQILGG